jgi:cell fate (sporulation/competence/biofilm development) regulator YlbF (YheA/YmcA/DUF963 family)
MTIIEKAKELGQMIQDSEEMKEVKQAEQVQNNDEQAQALLQDYSLKRMNLARDMSNGKITQEEAMKQNQADFEKLKENEAIGAYLKAKEVFDAMVQEVNGVLNFYITGQEQCTHDCSTCAGCH